MEHDSSLRQEDDRPPAGGLSGLAARTRGTLSSRDLALKVCVASVAAVLLSRLGPVAAIGGVAASLVVESAVESAVRRLRKRTLWGAALLALLLDRADRALAAVGLRSRRSAVVTPSAKAAAIAVAGSMVVVGFTIPEAALGHALVADRPLTFFSRGAAETVLRLPGDLTRNAVGPTRINYHVVAVRGGDAVPARCWPGSGSVFPIGRTIVTCEAGSTRESFAITIVRILPAVFPHDVEEEAIGPNGARVVYPLHAPAGTVRCTPAPGSTFALGRTPVACTARTGTRVVHGSFVVTVADTRRPSLSVPLEVRRSTTAATAVVHYLVSARDAVDGTVGYTCSPAAGSTFPIGTTTVHCTAADTRGNSVSRSFRVVVVHTVLRPEIVVPRAIVREATGPDGARVDFVASAHEGATVLEALCEPASRTWFALGTTTVRCRATAAGHTTTEDSFKVTVRDTTKPDLRVPPGQTRAAESHRGAVVSFTVTARDLVSGSVPVRCSARSGATFPIGTMSVSCRAKDAQGVEAVEKFRVSVVDGPPTFGRLRTVVAAALAPSGARVTYPPVTASDRVDGNAVVSCAPRSGSVFPLGTSTVSCTASDSAGNHVPGSFHVVVEDQADPTLIVPRRPLSAEAGEPFSYGDSVRAIDDVDGTVTPHCTPASESSFRIGSTVVSCWASDKAGHTDRDSFTVIAADRKAPVINVPQAPVLRPAGSQLDLASLVSARDAVDGDVPVSCKPPSGSRVALGPHTVDCWATDLTKHTERATFTVVGVEARPVVPVPTRP